MYVSIQRKNSTSLTILRSAGPLRLKIDILNFSLQAIGLNLRPDYHNFNGSDRKMIRLFCKYVKDECLAKNVPRKLLENAKTMYKLEFTGTTDISSQFLGH